MFNIDVKIDFDAIRDKFVGLVSDLTDFGLDFIDDVEERFHEAATAQQ